MSRLTLRMPTPEGTTPGGTALAKLPIGRRYHFLYLTYTGVTLAQLKEIRIKANNVVLHRYSAVDRDYMNQFYGLAAANGVLIIPFDRLGLKTRGGEETTAINTFSRTEQGKAITALHLEIDIDAAATAPVIKIDAMQSDAVPGGPGDVLYCLPFSRSVAGAGEFQVSDLPFNSKTARLLNAVHIKSSVITKAEIERDTYTVTEREKAVNDLIAKSGGRVPAAGWFSIDSAEQGYGGNLIDLRGVQDFRYILQCSAADAGLKFYPEFVGELAD